MSECVHYFNIFSVKIVRLVKSEGYHILAANIGNCFERICVVSVINNRLVRHFGKFIEGLDYIFDVLEIFKMIGVDIENYCNIRVKL